MPRPGGGLRKDWWQRTWGRLTGPFHGTWFKGASPPPIRMPTLLDVHEPSEEFSFETPARGDAFNFHIRVRCSWIVQATAPSDPKAIKNKTAEIRKFIQRNRAITRDRIEERIRPEARKFPPYRAAEAEDALNNAISDCLNDGDIRVMVRAWVDVPGPLREDLQKVWRERLVAESARDLERILQTANSELEGDLQLRHIKMLGERQQAWRELLQAGLAGIGAVDEAKATWLAPYALKLAEDPENAAGYLKDVLDRRINHAEDLLADLGALAMNDRIEAIEFAFQSQSVLHRLLMYLGVPIPVQNGAADA
jgi:hypothetical protein